MQQQTNNKKKKPVALVKPMRRLQQQQKKTPTAAKIEGIKSLYISFFKIASRNRDKYHISNGLMKDLALTGFYCCDSTSMSIKCWHCKLVIINWFKLNANTLIPRLKHLCVYSREISKLQREITNR